MLSAAATKEYTMRAMLLNGAVTRRCVQLLFALVCAAGLTSCGHKHATSAVGVGLGVSLTAPAGTTLVTQGGTLEIDAVVSNDASNKGVTWILTGTGSAVSSSATKYVYQAPSGVTGAVTVTLTATSITDPTQLASVTITVNGTPIIPQPILFPANLSIVYAAYFTVVGGTAPFAWTVTSGTLPAGLALDGSLTATTALSGTPTALGSSTFTLQAADSNGLKATVTVTLVVNPQTACLMLGRFAYLYTGFRGAAAVVRAGTVNVAADGTLIGSTDYKDPGVTRSAEAVTSGTCVTSTQNRGVLRLVSAYGTEIFDFGVISSLHSGHLQENDGTGVVGSGQFFQQDATAFTAAAIAGDYTFGVVGVDASARRLGVIGRLTVGANGAITGGVADTNEATPQAGAALTGTLSAPDANGRGTTTFTIGSLVLPVAYYVLNANTIYIVSNDATSSTPRIAGRMSRQTGAGTLDATALAGPAVLSLWGSSLVGGLPTATVAAGHLSGGTGGNVKVSLDVADRGAALVDTQYPTSPYTVTANGRGTLNIGTGSAAREFIVYMADAGDGYVLEPASAVGCFGILDRQVGAPFADFISSYYVGGTVFATSTSPISLLPQLLFREGALSGNVNGSYAIDPASGRAIATVSRNILGGSGLVIYIVSAQKLVVLGDGVGSVNSALGWLQAY